MSQLLINIQKLSKHFRVKKKFLHAVEEVDLQIFAGEILALVGESGSGKTTLGRMLLRLIEPTEGKIEYQGLELLTLLPHEMKPLRRRMQMIFQDPYSSLNPRMTIGEILKEPFQIHSLLAKKELQGRIEELMQMVGLDPGYLNRFPHEFSGGQRQRICIARSLAVDPEFLVCDEPVSALDVSVQAQLINLLKELQQKKGLTYLFISHDLSLVKYISDRVAVLYLGRILEVAPTEALFSTPLHPYTQALLSAIPQPDPNATRSRSRVKGDTPNLFEKPKGCPFATRCPYAMPLCSEKVPPLKEFDSGHFAACHLLTN
jgi:oligopeptide/dipeptide ABC transporter ATP-binding protein